MRDYEKLKKLIQNLTLIFETDMNVHQYNYTLKIPTYELSKFFDDEEFDNEPDYIQVSLVQSVIIPNITLKVVEQGVELISISCNIKKQADVEHYIKTNLTKFKRYEA
jgi:hypothetical protein